MATIRQIGKGSGRRFQAIVRKNVAGEKHHLSRVFWKAKEAEDWARRCEDAIVSSAPERPFKREEWAEKPTENVEVDDTRPHLGWTIERALRHYCETLTPMKRGAKVEAYRIGTISKWPLAQKTLAQLTRADLQAQVTDRLANGISGDTVRRELNILRALYRDAEDLWEIQNLPAPFHKLKLPKPSPERERRLEDGKDGPGEEERLRMALATWKRNPDVHVDLFDFSIATGLRLSEAHALTVAGVAFIDGLVMANLGTSKNGDRRRVVLNAKAREIAKRRTEGRQPHEKLFPISDSARRRAWAYARKVAGVTDLRWHDLRHEALSRMASLGLHLKELMAQSGHRDTESVARYINERTRDIARKVG